MSISWRGERTGRICLNALMIALAMMLSYLEVLLPLGAALPLPGFRLGLANLVVTLVFFLRTPTEAAVVSFVRIFLMALLFGSAISLFFSVLGGLCSYLMLLLVARIGKRLSFLGISVLCAAAHHCGQITAAVLLFGTGVILSYLPLLLVAAAIYGSVVGCLLNLVYPRLQNLSGRWNR